MELPCTTTAGAFPPLGQDLFHIPSHHETSMGISISIYALSLERSCDEMGSRTHPHPPPQSLLRALSFHTCLYSPLSPPLQAGPYT